MAVVVVVPGWRPYLFSVPFCRYVVVAAAAASSGCCVLLPILQLPHVISRVAKLGVYFLILTCVHVCVLLLQAVCGCFVGRKAKRTTMAANHVKKLDNYCVSVNKKVDLVAITTTRLIEDLTAFNKNYYDDLNVKTEKDEKVFEKIDKFLFDYKKSLSKVDLLSQSSISQDSISEIVSSIESSSTTELAPVINLVLRLPMNAPRFVHVSQGGERGVCSSKGSSDDTCVVVGKLFSTKTPITIPMKPISSIESITPMNDPQDNMDC